MNNDLISREALKKAIKTECNPYGKPTIDFESGKKVLELIDNAPTVELDESIIQEVLNKRGMTAVANEYLIALHGKRQEGEWIDTGDMQEYWAEEYQCSICGAKEHWHNYCPNCGAKMKGEAENGK